MPYFGTLFDTVLILPLEITTSNFHMLFIAVSVALFLALSSCILISIRQRKNKKRLLSALQQYEAKELKYQMNPHFLFNAMNNLQGIVAQRDDAATYEYISNLNVLTSSTFSMSQKELVTLDEELSYLTSYLTINTYRLNNTFSFEITVEDTIIPEITLLPPLLIQPLIENAIIHGLKPKSGDKNIWIHFYSRDDRLLVTIKDNGIGRAASKQLKKEQSLLTHSLSSKIFDKRLALYNTTHEKTIELSFVDLTEEDGEKTGTQVTLSISL